MWRIRYTPDEESRKVFAQLEALAVYDSYVYQRAPVREVVPPYSAISKNGFVTKKEAEDYIPRLCGKCPKLDEYSVEEY